MRFGRGLVILLFLLMSGNAAHAQPALIPMPSSVAWRDGNIALGANTVVEGQGEAASTAAYLARELGLKLGGRGSSRILLALVPATKIANPESYHLRASGKEILIEASDSRGLFYGAQTLRQLVRETSGSRKVSMRR